MTHLAYDPTRQSLYHPEIRQTLFLQNIPSDTRALAIEAARLAYLRFENSGDADKQLSHALLLAGYKIVTHFIHAPSDAAGYGALHEDGTALLALRGTQADHMLDLMTDASVLLVKWKLVAGRVHAGFRQSAHGLWPKIAIWLKGAAKHRTSLLICGHSLGAAIATLLAIPTKAQQLITIGSPRVGDEQFCSSLLEAPGLSITRIVDCCDGVTRVPPEALGYNHAGSPLYIDRLGTIARSPPSQIIESDREAARIEYATKYALNLGNVKIRDLADHAPINYARAFWPNESLI